MCISAVKFLYLFYVLSDKFDSRVYKVPSIEMIKPIVLWATFGPAHMQMVLIAYSCTHIESNVKS